jgi:glycosyltransferase involved in cell wall biosynthesis
LKNLRTDSIHSPLVSVVMNCYNSAEYLNESINSVLSQSYSNWEIIFWDNQSTDQSAEIVKGYVDKRIRYFYSKRHTSLGEARNLAIQQTRGEWIAFLDCDDIWFSQKLAKQIELVPKQDVNTGIVYGGMVIISGKTANVSRWSKNLRRAVSKQDHQKLIEGEIFAKLLQLNFIPMLSSLVRKSLYLEVGGIDSKLNQVEDYDLFLKISKVSKAKVVRENICAYRVHEGNATLNQLDKNFQEAIQVVSCYLPEMAAKKGVRCHQTYYAIHEFRNGLIIKPLFRLILKGSLVVLFKKISIFFRK